MNRSVLITGGAGFIGSHVVRRFINEHDQYKIYNLDLLTYAGNLENLKDIQNSKNYEFIKGDIRDKKVLENIFLKQFKNKNPIDSVFHFAGLKSVKESVLNPKEYWDINVNGTKNIINIMQKYECKTLIFSSSATIYGSSKEKLIPEYAEIKPINPYGETKVAIEKLLYKLAGCVKDNFVINNPSTNSKFNFLFI